MMEATRQRASKRATRRDFGSTPDGRCRSRV